MPEKNYIGFVNHLEISAKFTLSLSAVLNPARCIHLKLSKVLFLSLRSGSLGHCGADFPEIIVKFYGALVSEAEAAKVAFIVDIKIFN